MEWFDLVLNDLTTGEGCRSRTFEPRRSSATFVQYQRIRLQVCVLMGVSACIKRHCR